MDSLTIFILGGYSVLADDFHLGGYSETLGFLLSDNFHWGGGYSVLRLGLSDNFHFAGGILYSDLDSLTIFIGGRGGGGGGYSTE